jgi:hypothetical protein
VALRVAVRHLCSSAAGQWSRGEGSSQVDDSKPLSVAVWGKKKPLRYCIRAKISALLNFPSEKLENTKLKFVCPFIININIQ